MNVRTATEADRDALHGLYRDFFAEWPPPARAEVDLEEELAEVDEIVSSDVALVAEREGDVVGFALARRKRGAAASLTDLYVRPDARRQGVAAGLVRAAAAALRERGATLMKLTVRVDNTDARSVYERWGFREQELELAADLKALERRLGERAAEPSFGSIHVQTDDLTAVERAVRQFVPRLPGGSRGSVVAPPRNGWIAVYDELCDRNPAMLRRLARELSDRMGAIVLMLGAQDGRVVRYALLERGRVVDEYLSIPEYHAPLPPGDIIAMNANPTAVSRLTGAEPARVRAVARTARFPGELPPAPEHLAQLAGVLGIAGGGHGYDEAASIPGAIVLGRT